MNRILFLITLFCGFSMTTMAQNTKFGKPSQQEWDMQAWGEAPDAEAVIMCKTVEVAYNLEGSFQSYQSSNDPMTPSGVRTLGASNYLDRSMTTLTYKVKMRTKILKDSGKRYADVDILYYNNVNDTQVFDDISDLSVVVFKKVNGKVKKTRLSTATMTDERVSDDYLARHIVVPDVEAGTIIEYQYEIHSGRYEYLYDWYVQDDIPVMYSSCVMNIPVVLQFNMEVPMVANVKSNVKESTILLSRSGNDLSAPKFATSNLYTITSQDLVPWTQMAIGNKRISEMVKGPFHVHATLMNSTIPTPAPMPEGMRHIMLRGK